jgi:predicted NUDIX family NTP pyrophosphohydrolase
MAHRGGVKTGRHSAGVLFYRRGERELEVLLVHPGGPYWRKRDAGAWQIPKGEIEPGESVETAARREVSEELGVQVAGGLRALGQVRQAGGKLVDAFAVEQEVDAGAIVSTTFEMEWPPRSGLRASFPEIDAARWLTLDEASAAILPSQQPLLQRLEQLLDGMKPDTFAQ